MRLQDKVALVTGAGAGIGRATATTFAREGAAVIVVDVDADSGEGTVSEIESVGGTAAHFEADCGEKDQIDALFAFALRTFGRLDVLHNNHVWCEYGRIVDLSYDGWRRSLDVGLTSYWYATKLALESMVPRGSGSIISTASVSGIAGDFGMSAYNALKAGVVNFTRTAAIESARDGIRCNCICPGPILSDGMRTLHEQRPEVEPTLIESVPTGRYGSPEEVANVALFLASDESSYVTGTALVVDGGLLAHGGTPPILGFGTSSRDD